MKIKNIINTIFPDKETRKKSVEKDLNNTVNELIKENKLEKKDEYFIVRLIKQYNRLTAQAQEYGINIQEYVNKMDEAFEVT
jgi:hypothetical protein